MTERPPEAMDCILNQPHKFAYENGIYVVSAEPERAEGMLIIREDNLNLSGSVHGGALAALADTIAGVCACYKDKGCFTTQCTMEYLRPAKGEKIICVATPKMLGGTFSVIKVELTGDDGKLVATGTFTFFMTEGIVKVEERD